MRRSKGRASRGSILLMVGGKVCIVRREELDEVVDRGGAPSLRFWLVGALAEDATDTLKGVAAQAD